jgi:hypothetical protein
MQYRVLLPAFYISQTEGNCMALLQDRSMRGDRQFGKENNSAACWGDYDRQTTITNTMQKVEIGTHDGNSKS